MRIRPPLPRLERRRALATILWLAAWPGGVGAADGFDLAQLMQLLAQVKAGEARFTERRQVAMLEQTLESKGRLWFEAPDTFVRETLAPRRERLAVSGNTLTLSQGNRSRTLALDSAPEAAVIVEAIRGTLTGNGAALERHFSASVSGGAAQWSLELVPLDARLRGQVASVRVAGRQSAVREVHVALADGDRSVMLIEPVTAPANSPASAPPAPAAPASGTGS
jgi:Outer membrane lipoprotein carrier protein LolA-like